MVIASSHDELRGLPLQWTCVVHTFIISRPNIASKHLRSLINDPEHMLLATRRSAGLPFAVRALLRATNGTSTSFQYPEKLTVNFAQPRLRLDTTFPRLCSFSSIKRKMVRAINIQLRYVHEIASTQVAKVHALNVIRGVILDKSLSDDLGSLFEDIAEVVFDLFASTCMYYSLPLCSSNSWFVAWNVRNSASLCFSALLQRLTGAKNPGICACKVLFGLTWQASLVYQRDQTHKATIELLLCHSFFPVIQRLAIWCFPSWIQCVLYTVAKLWLRIS